MMSGHRWATIIALLISTAWAWAQAGGPHVGYAYPAGGKQGTTFRVVVGGQLLRGANGVWVSGEGARGRVVEYYRPLNDQELRDTQWFLRELVRRRWSIRVMDYYRNSDDPPELPDHPWLRDLDHKTPGELARLRNRLFDPKTQLNPQLSEQVEIEVRIDADALVGRRELRLLTPNGVTNALCFDVAGLPEFLQDPFDELQGQPVRIRQIRPRYGRLPQFRRHPQMDHRPQGVFGLLRKLHGITIVYRI